MHRSLDSPATFFVTKSLWPKKPVLTPGLRQIVCSAFRFAVEQRRILLRAFVVMPDHWHGLFALSQDWALPRFMHAMMSFVGGKTAARLQGEGCAWEEGFYETRIRSRKQFMFVVDYITLNPVKKNLVRLPEEWDANHLRLPAIIEQPWPLEYAEEVAR